MKRFNIILIGLVLFVSSCQNYLDVQPQGKVIPKTDEEFAAIMHNIINSVEGGEDYLVIGNFESVMLYESYSDNLDANVTVGKLTAYVGDKINTRQYDYRYYFGTIRDCNIILEHLTGRDTKLSKQTRAVAYAVKGICYYNLIRDYCEAYDKSTASSQLGMPLIDKFDMEAMPARASLESTVEYCAEMLQKSIDYNIEDGLFLFTRDIVKGYLAKLYFWKEDWQSTIAVGEELMKLPLYQLSSIAEYEKMIQTKNAAYQEIVVRSHINNNSDIDWYFSMLVKDIRTRPVSKSLIDLFEKDGDADVRKAITFDKKRVTQKAVSAKFRSAEVVLMLAEAYAHNGENEKALEWLNLLRRNRIVGVEDYTMPNLPAVRDGLLIDVDATGAELTPIMATIFDERRKELYLEGDRWFELKRNGSPEFWMINNGLKYTTKKFLYTAPIYKSDVFLNDNMEQNAGYEGL